MWYTYIVQCKDSKLYTGITNDLNRRLAKHNSGHGGRFTRFRKPVKLVYRQLSLDKSSALKTEIELKKLKRHEKLILIKCFNFWRKITSAGSILEETQQERLLKGLKISPIQKLKQLRQMAEYTYKQSPYVAKKIRKHLESAW